MNAPNDLDYKITSISPEFEDTILGGHFKVTFGLDNVFKLNFSSFLRTRFEKDEKLREYVKSGYCSDITASAIVQDLYEIGCPMDEWVREHFENVRSRVSQFDALIALYLHLKQFGDDEPTRSGE